MSSYQAALEAASRWIDRVAATLVEAIDCFRPRQRYRLAEQEDGTFVLRAASGGEPAGFGGERIRILGAQTDAALRGKLEAVLRGAQVELLLRPKHFLFRPLELPRRAADFLEGIVRAQIDRLTPWSLAEAAFGFLPPSDTTGERMSVTIAATANKLIAPYVNAVSALGVDLIVAAAALDAGDREAKAIKVGEYKVGKAADLHRMRRVLVGLLVGAGVFAALSVAADFGIGGALETRQEELSSAIAERRAAMGSGRDRASAALAGLERRKHETPSAVIAIEALSRILPDDTYLTELRIAGDKVQITGLTHNAPSLIRLIEQIPNFTKATFFAPTTRSKTEQGEHFSIEAHIEPVFTPEP